MMTETYGLVVYPTLDHEGHDCALCQPVFDGSTLVPVAGLHTVLLKRSAMGGVAFRLCPDHIDDLIIRLQEVLLKYERRQRELHGGRLI